MRTRLLVQTALWLGAMGVMLFVLAGDWRWPQAWVFLAEQGLGGLAVGFPAFVPDACPINRSTRP
jgi:hypothetical protein